MKTTLALSALSILLLAGAAGAAQAAPSVDIRDAAARVVVMPEARNDVKVEFISTNAALPLTVRNDGDKVIVDGNLGGRHFGGHWGIHNMNCMGPAGHQRVRIHGIEATYEQLPQILVRVPMDAKVGAGGAVFGSVGRTNSIELSNAGCGDWVVGNSRGSMKINVAGSGDVRTGTASQLVVHVAGSGDVFTQAIAGGAEVDVAGSGDVAVAAVNGPVRAAIAGSGDVRFSAGHATDLVVHIAGSGDVRFGGTADSVNASIAGSGDVDVAHATGPVHKSVIGSGSVNVGG